MTEIFAGFTQAEWARAFATSMSPASAAKESERLFAAITQSGSNGYSLPPEVWAVLAHVSDRGRERVSSAMHHYPAQFRAQVLALLDEEIQREASQPLKAP